MDAVGAMAGCTDNCSFMFCWHCVLFLLWTSKFMLSWHMEQDHLHLCLSEEDTDLTDLTHMKEGD